MQRIKTSPDATHNKNSHIELFHSILEREVFGYQYFVSFQEAYEESRNL